MVTRCARLIYATVLLLFPNFAFSPVTYVPDISTPPPLHDCLSAHLPFAHLSICPPIGRLPVSPCRVSVPATPHHHQTRSHTPHPLATHSLPSFSANAVSFELLWHCQVRTVHSRKEYGDLLTTSGNSEPRVTRGVTDHHSIYPQVPHDL